MDFEDMVESLPRPTLEWSTQDVITWLQLNNLNAVVPKFKNLNIDGKAFAKMNQTTIVSDLKVTSLTFMKRLVEWVEMGREEYDLFLEKHLECQPPKEISTLAVQPHGEVKFIQSSLFVASKATPSDLSRLKPKLCITVPGIKQEFIVDSTTKVGRAHNNHIVIPEDSISRLHAQITVAQEFSYFVKDYSRFGTFIQILSKYEVHQKLHLIIGNTDVIVAKLKASKASFDLTLNTPEQKQLHHYFSNRTTICIGKKSKDINLCDESLNNNHCRIFLQQDKVFVQAQEGPCYRRLSQGQRAPLSHDVVRMGTTLMECDVVMQCLDCNKVIRCIDKSEVHMCDCV